MMHDDEELCNLRAINVPSSTSFVSDTRMDSTIDGTYTYNYDDASYAYSDGLIGDNSITQQIPVFNNYDQSIMNESSVGSSFLRFYEESNFTYDDLDINTLKGSHAGVPSVSFNTPTRESNDVKHEDKEDDAKSCVPAWMTNASTSLKIVILFSTALLVGCLALISIASTVPVSDSVTEVQGSTGGAIYITFAPTISPRIVDVPIGVTPTVALPVVPTKEPTYMLIITLAPTDQTIMQDEPEEISIRPTEIPTVVTSAPTKAPSIPLVAATAQPTLSPTVGSNNPSMVTAVVPTKYPSSNPSIITVSPSSLPKIVSFYATSRYRSPQLAAQLGMLPSQKSHFLIHLGNWNTATPGICKEFAYSKTAQTYQNSTVPVLFVPGYNEWNRCTDTDVSQELWRTYLIGTENHHEHNFDVIRQKHREENFAFVHQDVLFLGLNMVAGPDDSLTIRLDDNTKWMQESMAKYSKDVQVVVIFGSSGIWNVNAPFSTTLSSVIQKYTEIHPHLTFVYVKESLDEVSSLRNVLGFHNLLFLNVKAKEWPPLRISIDVNHHTVSWGYEE